MDMQHNVGVLALTLAALLAQGPRATAQVDLTTDAPPVGGFVEAAESIQAELESSVAELEALQTRIVDEKLPLSRELAELEQRRRDARAEFDQVSRTLATRALDLTRLTGQIEDLEDETAFLSTLLVDYIRNFKASLHIAERQRYEEVLEAAGLAPENDALTKQEVFLEQSRLLDESIDRLMEAAGGTRFDGRAVGSDGLVENGTFLLAGPLALFRSRDGRQVGTVEDLAKSTQPRVVAFEEREDAAAAEALVTAGGGLFPVDTTLGNAHKIAATEETFIGELEKGGTVIWPILGMATVALVVAIFKWLSLSFVRRPSKAQLAGLLDAVRSRDVEAAERQARKMRGPVGRMLAAGVEHLRQPRELIEEVMYETVLTTRLRLNRMLPFIAICAASAPLLGLLGTVTGIINTFKQITLFGSGDVKMLSGGISEALITTKYGLIVAIPSLMLHAFLSRKARGIVGEMETSAVAFMNEVSRMPSKRRGGSSGGDGEDSVTLMPSDPELVRRQVSEVLNDLLGPLVDESEAAGRSSGAGRVVPPASSRS
ncbi:MotA/TolQ/ExbB proton channel family protein [Engelhardtia mirabilis]|uniref:Biopolymer transport protein ExbB n=1 Tax=Engelhardtia mirabilis TaxID=2528011 RepID=A0A518BGH6_9BACT|nr:Biopolymer transport protein ExbB [Planctomycetes bacterium Pla133]QDV00416.1 Biopolymer transport protein ExbB [Planctomycetes bacterium Pla86]